MALVVVAVACAVAFGSGMAVGVAHGKRLNENPGKHTTLQAAVCMSAGGGMRFG